MQSHERRLDFSCADERVIRSSITGLSWSPNARQLAAGLNCTFRYAKPTSEIWVANRDGSSARRVVRDGAHPSWSRDGEWLAYDRHHSQSLRSDGTIRREYQVLAVHLGNGHVRRLTTSRGSQSHPVWRPR